MSGDPPPVRHSWCIHHGSFAGPWAECRCGWRSSQSHNEYKVRVELDAHIAETTAPPMHILETAPLMTCGSRPNDERKSS